MKKVFKYIFAIIAGFISFQFGLTIYETISINKEIKSFIAKAVLNEDISTNEIKYYEVSRETYYPEEFERIAFFDNDLEKPGAEGDVFVTTKTPFSYLAGIYEVTSFFFGGHAAYVGPNNEIFQTVGFLNRNEYLIKAIFKGGEETHAHISENYWLKPDFHDEKEENYKKFGSYYRKEWIGLRVKGVTKEEINQVTEIMFQLEQDKVQYNFLFTSLIKSKYYCTDMMSRPYGTITYSNGEQKYNLNMDGLAVTVNDLITSKDTYIAYYVRTDKYNVKHIYYIN